MDENSPVAQESGTLEPSMPEAAGGSASLVSWLDQDDVLRELWLKNMPPSEIATKLNRSVAAIMTRAARLGLPRRFAPGRKAGQRYELSKTRLPISRAAKKAVDSGDSSSENAGDEKPQFTSRICLMCLRKFPSAGRHNRICPACKNSHEYISGSRVPDTTFGSI